MKYAKESHCPVCGESVDDWQREHFDNSVMFTGRCGCGTVFDEQYDLVLLYQETVTDDGKNNKIYPVAPVHSPEFLLIQELAKLDINNKKEINKILVRAKKLISEKVAEKMS